MPSKKESSVLQILNTVAYTMCVIFRADTNYIETRQERCVIGRARHRPHGRRHGRNSTPCRTMPAKRSSLRSLIHHREGLSVFVDPPQVPMDHRPAKRTFQGCGGREKAELRLRQRGGRRLHRRPVLRHRHPCHERHPRPALASRGACGLRPKRNGGQPPDDPDPWRPRPMSPERRRDLRKPG